jgi:hypothetical protein
MAVKYELGYFDVENIFHEVSISDENYEGISIEINGNVSYSLSESDSPDESIRGTGITLNLEASIDNDFSDLYSESEKSFLVQYKVGGAVFFNGWLSSEGYFEDFVRDYWIISFQCSDGLSFLTDLSYVDSSGIFFSGNQTQLEIVVNCLNRTGIFQNINTNIDIYYTDLNTSLDVLDNVIFDADRFVKDDGETIMSCDEVIRDVLEPYNASIISYKGEWYIYKLNQLYSDSTPTFFRYDSDGLTLSPASKTIDVSFNLGSQIDGFYPHHAGGNQSITNRKSIGAYRISYKYGLVKALLTNIFLEHNNVIVYEWTINEPNGFGFKIGGFGFSLDTGLVNTTQAMITSDDISLSVGNSISYTIDYETIDIQLDDEEQEVPPLSRVGYIVYRILLEADGGGFYFYKASTNEWLPTSGTTIFGSLNQGDLPPELGTTVSLSFSTPPIPESGTLNIVVYRPRTDINVLEAVASFSKISVSPSQNNDLKGEFHTFQRKTKPSPNVKETKQVNNGDNPSEIYYGTIYKADGDTPTSTWFRKGFIESKPILRIMGEETLRLGQKTAREFTGDVYGFIPFLSIVSINNLTGVYAPLSINYDSKSNISSIKLVQVFNEDLADDILYEKTFDYGNTVKPTIIG